MEDITAEQAARDGVTTGHQRMDNGERRYRLMGGDGSGYIRTQAGERGAWQNSHYHNGARELYIVQRGWMDLALWKDEELSVERLGEGAIRLVAPGEIHNARPGPGAVLHTVKFGAALPGDWHGAPDMDKALEEAETSR